MRHMVAAAGLRLQHAASLGGKEQEELSVVKFAAVPSIRIPMSRCPDCQMTQVTARFEGNDGDPDPMLVLKEPATNNALGVHITSLSTLPALLTRLAEIRTADACNHLDASNVSSDSTVEYVVQQYVRNPVLLQGHKFHLRVNVVAVGALDVFIHRDIVCHVACERWDATPTSQDMFRLQHITNHCVQRTHPSYDSSRTLLLTALSRLMFPDEGELALAWEQTIVRRISSLIRQLFQFVLCEKRQCNRRYGFIPTRNAFDLFGVDILLSHPPSEDLKNGPWPVLIEVNAGPALEGIASPELCKQVVEDITKLAIDPLLRAAGQMCLHDASDTSAFFHIFSHRPVEAAGEHPWYSPSLIEFAAQTLAKQLLRAAADAEDG
jgi:hypothetical protein